MDQRFKGTGSARVSGGTVTFEPCARTAWHTHPLGQTLFVLSGVAASARGRSIEEIRPGDVVWIPAASGTGTARPRHCMSHVAVAEALDGKTADWMEKVTDEQCGN